MFEITLWLKGVVDPFVLRFTDEEEFASQVNGINECLHLGHAWLEPLDHEGSALRFRAADLIAFRCT